MNDTELCYLPATEALRLFRTHKLSPVELLEAQIKRADEVEPIINAFTDTFYDKALKKAKAAEKRDMVPRGRVRKLEGLTVAIKDEMEVKGQRNTQGSLILKDYIATTTDPAVERLLRAGAIIHARTTTPEFSCAWITHTRLHGTTSTPWNPIYTSSGSSGGSAASLATGTSSLATGSDIGGSIRGPAAACGVVGYKPPYGRVPQSPPFNLDWYCHVGPLARREDGDSDAGASRAALAAAACHFDLPGGLAGSTPATATAARARAAPGRGANRTAPPAPARGCRRPAAAASRARVPQCARPARGRSLDRACRRARR